MKTVYIVGGGHGGYSSLFTELGFKQSFVPEEADLAVFTGGADVTPSIYGDKAHPTVGCDHRRDEMEQEYFDLFTKLCTPMVGICRGGQFLNVMNGGRMYQHVSKHALADGHSITDLETGETIYVSSTHHQMIMPSPEALIVATAALGGTREWYDGEMFRKDISNEDIEVVYYEKNHCLCFQPHPEYNRVEYVGMRKYFYSLLERFLLPVTA